IDRWIAALKRTKLIEALCAGEIRNVPHGAYAARREWRQRLPGLKRNGKGFTRDPGGVQIEKFAIPRPAHDRGRDATILGSDRAALRAQLDRRSTVDRINCDRRPLRPQRSPFAIRRNVVEDARGILHESLATSPIRF